MNKVLFLSMLLGLQLSAQADLTNFTVKKVLRNDMLSIESVDVKAINFDNGTVTNGFPGKAVATFQINGKYSSGYCWIEDIFLQNSKIPQKIGNYQNISYEMKLIGVKQSQKTKENIISLADEACAGGSMGRFKMNFEIRISMWGGNQKTQTYHYKIKSSLFPDGEGTGYTVLTVVYDIETGWSYKMRKEKIKS